eukprot:4221410-Pyramimonas_sp.AAC.1
MCSRAATAAARIRTLRSISGTSLLTALALAMSWRATAGGSRPRSQTAEAAAATLAPRQKQARGGQKKAIGKESGSGDHNDEEIVLLQKLALNNAQMIRQLSGSLWDFFLIPGEHSA